MHLKLDLCEQKRDCYQISCAPANKLIDTQTSAGGAASRQTSLPPIITCFQVILPIYKLSKFVIIMHVILRKICCNYNVDECLLVVAGEIDVESELVILGTQSLQTDDVLQEDESSNVGAASLGLLGEVSGGIDIPGVMEFEFVDEWGEDDEEINWSCKGDKARLWTHVNQPALYVKTKFFLLFLTTFFRLAFHILTVNSSSILKRSYK